MVSWEKAIWHFVIYFLITFLFPSFFVFLFFFFLCLFLCLDAKRTSGTVQLMDEITTNSLSLLFIYYIQVPGLQKRTGT